MAVRRPLAASRLGDQRRGGGVAWIIEAPIGGVLHWVKGQTDSGIPVLTPDRDEASYWRTHDAALAWGNAHLTTRSRNRWHAVRTHFPK